MKPHSEITIYDWILVGLIICLIIIMTSCATLPSNQYHLNDLTVIFLEPEQILEAWEEITGRPTTQTLGFYDRTTKTIYCPMWEFEICGHELHHALFKDGPLHKEWPPGKIGLKRREQSWP